MTKKKREKKYKCEKHSSNQGYINKEGKWCCWFCYYENLYLNPNGVVLKELEIKSYVIRIVDRTDNQNKSLCVEVFVKDTKVVDDTYTCRDLSMAIRHFDTMIREILRGTYGRREKKSYPRDEEAPRLEIPHFQAPVISGSTRYIEYAMTDSA